MWLGSMRLKLLFWMDADTVVLGNRLDRNQARPNLEPNIEPNCYDTRMLFPK